MKTMMYYLNSLNTDSGGYQLYFGGSPKLSHDAGPARHMKKTPQSPQQHFNQ